MGVWVGKTLMDDSHILLTQDGVRTARSIARLSADKQWDAKFVATLKGSPWNPLGTAARESVQVGGEALHKPASRRRMYIPEAVVQRFGKSKGCAACRGGGRHTEHPGRSSRRSKK